MALQDEPKLEWPLERESLLPFAPMIYVAWADGVLDANEVRTIRDRLDADERVDAGCRAVVRRWLDPDHAPRGADLLRLLAVIRREGSERPRSERWSLVELGLSLLPPSSREADPGYVDMVRALEEVEAALGIVGVEASRTLLARDRPTAPPPEEPVDTDVSALQALLEGPHAETRARLREVLGAPAFRIRAGRSTETQREEVHTWLAELAEGGFGALAQPAEFGGAGDFGGFLNVMEVLGTHDLSLMVKFGVQFGLFGGSVQLLGTQRHHERYLEKIGDLRLPGCFAMTELGHGSNVWDLETTATYDRKTDELIVDTPTATARKEWIGNAAVHGRLATVFAQLQVAGERHGVHAVLVPIRDERGEVLPGVTIEDCGHKEGLNGVDNGRIWFDGVRVPRDNLLDRFGRIDPSGEYESPIPSPGKRFFSMLGTLVGGRIAISGAALSAAKLGLTIAVRYVRRRRQFGPDGESEVPVLDYLTVHRRLVPAVATAYALSFAQHRLVQRFLEREEGETRELETLAAGLKAYGTWNTISTLQQCREVCGGQGYLSVNRLPDLKADSDIFATFEGDNTVLMQLVAKGLLTEYRHQFQEMRFWGILRFLADRAATAVAERNPVATRITDPAHLQDPEFHRSAFAYREERLLHSVARRLKARIDDGMDTFDAFNACQDHLVAVGRAHVERVVYEDLAEAAAKAASSIGDLVESLRDVFALSRIEADRAWYLESGFMEPGKTTAIRALLTTLCAELRPAMGALVEGFAIPDAMVQAPIAFGIDPRRPPTA